MKLSENEVMALLIAERKFKELAWRHHGIGLLQAYLPDTNFRLHIWNRRLILPGMRESGAMHNHRFDLKSRILHGSLVHTDIKLEDINTLFAANMFSLWKVVGASKGSSDDMMREATCDAHFHSTERCCAGMVYEVPKWEFHYARQELDDTEYTLTLVEVVDKEKDKFVSILTPYGERPVHAFERETDLIPGILEAAHPLFVNAVLDMKGMVDPQ